MYGDYFFFQAEDGIRDTSVTGVQTCALPISLMFFAQRSWGELSAKNIRVVWTPIEFSTGTGRPWRAQFRSEERRVGKSVDLGGRRIIKKKKRIIDIESCS